MTRVISDKSPAVVRTERPPRDSDIAEWLTTWLSEHPEAERTVLAHAETGVSWWRITGAAMDWPDIPKLRHLQQLRLFGEKGELFLWRDGERIWHGRSILEVPAASAEGKTFTSSFDEGQLVWEVAESWTARGAQETGREASVSKLKVRHYLSEDETGFVRICASRLVKLA